MKVSVIGSFRKYYDDIVKIIELFEKNHIDVLSPKISEIIDPKQEFVLLKCDNERHTPIDIQLIAFHRILRSDFVYALCPNGYIGRTTCYEIGRIVERKIPLYFSELPKDLPIYIPELSIISPKEFISYYNKHKVIPKNIDIDDTSFTKKLHNDLYRGEYYD